MIFFVNIILVLLGLSIGAIVLYQGVTRKVEILCLRNFFLLGFIVFQISSAVLSFHARSSGDYPVTDWERVSALYTFAAVLYIVIFLGAYHAGLGMSKLAASLRFRTVQPGATATLTLSVIFLISGIGLFLGVKIPYIGIIAMQVGAAFLAIAVALAGWAWAPRMFNPVVVSITGGVLLLALFALFMSSGFGRRDMVGLGAGFIWGAYFSYWRYLEFKQIIFRFAAIGSAAIILLALVTTTRFIEGREDLSAGQRISNLQQGSVTEGLYELAAGQGCGGYSVYFVETRPQAVPYDYLHSVKLFFTLAIPRTYWPDKPDALGITSVDEIRAKGKPEGWNIGPGMIGHIWNDFPYVALPLYAIIFAMFFRFTDDLIKWNVTNPFVVVPMGVALGQVIALPRGELGNFSAKMIGYIIGAWVAMQLVGRFVSLFAGSGAIFASEEAWEDEDEYEDDDLGAHEVPEPY